MRRSALLVLVLLGSGVRTLAPAAAQADPPTTRVVRLSLGWNLVGWTGSVIAADSLTAELGGVFASLHAFDAPVQAFESVNASGPDFANSLQGIAAGAGLWIFAETLFDWEQPVLTTDRSVRLEAGFNLVTWTGASGTPIAVALGGLGDAVEVAFLYDAVAALFLSWGPALPPILVSAETLRYGDGMWVKVDRAIDWDQPAPPPGGRFTGADGSFIATVPVGMDATVDIAEVDASELPDPALGSETLAAFALTLTLGPGNAARLSAQQLGPTMVPPDGVDITYTPDTTTQSRIAPEGFVEMDGDLFQLRGLPGAQIITVLDTAGNPPPQPRPPTLTVIDLDGNQVELGSSIPAEGWILEPGAQRFGALTMVELPVAVGGRPPPGPPVMAWLVTVMDGPDGNPVGGVSLRAGGARQLRITIDDGIERVTQVESNPAADVPLTLPFSCDPAVGFVRIALQAVFDQISGLFESRGRPRAPHGPVRATQTPQPDTIQIELVQLSLCGDGDDGALVWVGLPSGWQSLGDPDDNSPRPGDPDFAARDVDFAGRALGDLVDGAAGFATGPAPPFHGVCVNGGDPREDFLVDSFFDVFLPVCLGGGGVPRLAAPGALRSAQAGEAAEWISVAYRVAAEIPLASEEFFFVYALVFDGDGNPNNNWVPLPQFPGDFFQGTDRWYEARYSPETAAWTVRRTIVLGGTPRIFETEARVRVTGDTVAFLIPRGEIPLESGELPFRVSAFVYERTDLFGFDRGLSSGETFPDVTEPLALLPLS